MPRSYKSEVRDAQSAATREALVDHAVAILQSEGIDALTLPRLATRAGFSVPTVYRHFATLDDLLAALLDYMRERLGMTTANLTERTAEQIPDLPGENFPRFLEHRALLEPLMSSRAWNRVRIARAPERTAGMLALLKPLAPGLSDEDAHAAGAAMFLLATPAAWRWLRETGGLDDAQATRAAAWAMRTLLAALPATETLEVPKKTRKKKVK